MNYRLVETLAEELQGPVVAMFGGGQLVESDMRRVLEHAYAAEELRRIIAMKTLILLQARGELQALRDLTQAILDILGT